MGLKLSEKAKNVIRTVAPTLGAALGGPLGGMAGNVISAALGGKDDQAVEDALLTQKPETLLALRAAENEFTLKMREMDISEDKLVYQDLADARSLAKVNMAPQMGLSAVFVTGYFTVFLWMLATDIELSIRQATMVNVLMGVLTAGVVKILDFWFGSTAGSMVKSHLLAESKPAGADK